ncbi:hypothetical protein M2133_003166, partial [Parabacteroides sp. PF5-6]|nr:hypothetical protein [Parabacteroides sp. PF5-6]
ARNLKKISRKPLFIRLLRGIFRFRDKKRDKNPVLPKDLLGVFVVNQQNKHSFFG